MPSGKKRKGHKMATHKRKKRAQCKKMNKKSVSVWLLIKYYRIFALSNEQLT